MSKPHLYSISLLSALLAAAPSLGNAQSSTQNERQTLERLTVLAPAVDRDDALPQSFIDRETIAASQSRDLLELLRMSAGVQTARTGGPAGLNSMFLRGTESNHVLVLVDGIRVADAVSGTAPWSNISPELIESVRILRGPRSVSYGSDAIGGVIMIRSRSEARESQQAHRYGLRLAEGNRATEEVDIDLQGPVGIGAFNYALGLSYAYTDGIDALVGPDGRGLRDRDAWRRSAWRLSLGGQITEGTVLQLQLSDSETEGEYDPLSCFSPCADDIYYTSELSVARIALEQTHSDRHNSTLQFGQTRNNRMDFRQYTDRLTSTDFGTRRDSLNWEHSFELSLGSEFSVGLDYFDDQVESSTNYAETKRYNAAIYVEQEWTGDRHWLNLALRYDDNEQFGGNTVASADWGLQLNQAVTAILSAGTAFVAPSFGELYFPGFGNPNLKPEESLNLELGLVHRSGRQSFSAYVFSNRVDNLIAFDSSINIPVNIREAQIRGLEWQWQWNYDSGSLQLNGTLLDPKDDATEQLLQRRSRRQLNAMLTQRYGDWRFGLDLEARGHSYEDLSNTLRLGGYGLLGLRVEWAPRPMWRLQLKLNNLLDREYVTAAGSFGAAAMGFREEGFGALLSLRMEGGG